MISLFSIFCALLITCATFVVQCHNPVYSVLFLILAFFNASALVLLAGHEYMAVLLIVLYVGAMCTFFLFAIMILDIKVEPISEKRLKFAPINAIVATLFALQCKHLMKDFESQIQLPTFDVESGMNVFIHPLTSQVLDSTTQIYALGALLYTHYAIALILASLILLSAMLGSIALTLSRSPTVTKTSPQIYEQNLRDFKQTIVKYR